MLQDLYLMRMTRGACAIDPHYTKLSSVQVEQNGILVRSSEYKESCVDDTCKQFTFLDFEIANVLALGALNMLNPVSMVNHDVTGVASAFDNLNEKLNGHPEETK